MLLLYPPGAGGLQGKQPKKFSSAQGNPIWNITATRDTAIDVKVPSFNKGHRVDNNIDPERDMIMADLIKSGVKDWHLTQGELSAADKQAIAGHYTPDGKVYTVELNP
jgi:hypothetical protein